MNIYGILPITASLFLLALGVFIFIQGIRVDRAYYKVAFAFGCFCCFIWLFFAGVMYIAKSVDTASIYGRIALCGAIFTAMAFHHFIVLLLNRHERFLIVLTYLLGIIFTILTWIPNGFVRGFYEYSWGYYPNFTQLNILSMLVFAALFTRGAVLSYFGYQRKLKQGLVTEANRIKYIFWGFVVGPIAGIDYLPGYGIDFYPFGFLIMTIWVCIISYAILRHRLMSIEIVIRETAIFAGIFGFSIGLFILAIAAGEQVLQPYIGQNKWVVPAFSLFLVTFAIRPIEKLVYNLVGRYLFRKKFEYQKTLQHAAEGMSRIRDPKRLLSLIVHLLSAKLKLENIAILLYEKTGQCYRVKALRGKIDDRSASLTSENPLIQWLYEKKKPIELEDIQKWANDVSDKGSLEILRSDLLQIENSIKVFNAVVVVPCFFREELLGVLAMGRKKTGDFFSQDDLGLFSALSGEAAIALKNSQLYFEIDKKANEIEDMYKREHRLFTHASIAFAAAIDARDPYTHGHSQRVTDISLILLDYAGVMDEVDKNVFFRQRLQIAGVLHDIGKIGVPDEILHKPSKLTLNERKQIERHPVIGADIISHIKGLRHLIGGIKHHHERYDGKGYPDGLKSDQIPLMARIIAVADTYDAMTSDRPYRNGLSALTAKQEIQRNASSQFDPYIVAAFLKAFEQEKIK
jgi:HD-GYP domain-containing protein (c-di-GMP phosphodiesterase class II)